MMNEAQEVVSYRQKMMISNEFKSNQEETTYEEDWKSDMWKRYSKKLKLISSYHRKCNLLFEVSYLDEDTANS